MSKACKLTRAPLIQMNPHWVEFTSKAGVLRVLQPKEDLKKAQGLVFNCPHCMRDKQKKHFCIFLFDFDNVPPAARPLGRFEPTFETPPEGTPVKKVSPFECLTLHQVSATGPKKALLKPQDLQCEWEGYVVAGNVSWREHPLVSFVPNLAERVTPQ